MFYLVVNVHPVIDGDFEAGRVEDVKGLREQGQFEAGRCSQKNATATSLSYSVLTGLKHETSLFTFKIVVNCYTVLLHCCCSEVVRYFGRLNTSL